MFSMLKFCLIKLYFYIHAQVGFTHSLACVILLINYDVVLLTWINCVLGLGTYIIMFLHSLDYLVPSFSGYYCLVVCNNKLIYWTGFF
jgi:hypothetical protein